MIHITYQEAAAAAEEMAQLTDIQIYLLAETEKAVRVSRQDVESPQVWIPAFMCEIGPGENSNTYTVGMGARTLTAAKKVLQWKGLIQ